MHLYIPRHNSLLILEATQSKIDNMKTINAYILYASVVETLAVCALMEELGMTTPALLLGLPYEATKKLLQDTANALYVRPKQIEDEKDRLALNKHRFKVVMFHLEMIQPEELFEPA